jgi:hypothetical protein
VEQTRSGAKQCQTNRSSSGKLYQPIDLSKQTKIHVLGDIDLKGFDYSDLPNARVYMRTVWMRGDRPSDRAPAHLEKNGTAGQQLQAGAAERQSREKFWHADWLTASPSPEERHR